MTSCILIEFNIIFIVDCESEDMYIFNEIVCYLNLIIKMCHMNVKATL